MWEVLTVNVRIAHQNAYFGLMNNSVGTARLCVFPVTNSRNSDSKTHFSLADFVRSSCICGDHGTTPSARRSVDREQKTERTRRLISANCCRALGGRGGE